MRALLEHASDRILGNRTWLLAIGLGLILAVAAVVGRTFGVYENELYGYGQQQRHTLPLSEQFVEMKAEPRQELPKRPANPGRVGAKPAL